MADLSGPIIAASAGILGALAGMWGQYFSQRSATERERGARREVFQRTTLLELQDGPLAETIPWVRKAIEWADRPDTDVSDGSDQIWESFFEFAARYERLQARIADDECRAAVASLLDDMTAMLRASCSSESVAEVWAADRRLTARIGELLRAMN